MKLKPIKSAYAAEIQAVAIYEAEVFWARHPERRALLVEILGEERAHLGGLEDFVEMSKPSRFGNRMAGWILGTVLSILPWPILCRVQAWAENTAAEVYADTVRQLEKIEGLDLSQPAIQSLIANLNRAYAQEKAHSLRFYAPRL